MSGKSLISETAPDTPAQTTTPGADGPELVDITAHRTSLRASLLDVVGYRQLLKHLVLKDLKLKYRGSVLGFVWSLLNPLVMLTVYTVAFKYIMGIRGSGFVSRSFARPVVRFGEAEASVALSGPQRLVPDQVENPAAGVFGKAALGSGGTLGGVGQLVRHPVASSSFRGQFLRLRAHPVRIGMRFWLPLAFALIAAVTALKK